MDRFFARSESWEDRKITLDAEESHHCLRVMRKRGGDEIEVFDGTGRWARGEVAGEECGRVWVEVAREGRSEESSPLITLAVAVAKGKTIDLVVQKAVELGANAIQPLLTEHTVVRMNDEEGRKKAEKWQRVALEACKQCGRNVLPRVSVPVSLEKWIALRDQSHAGLLASLMEGAVSMKEALGGLREAVPSLDLLIGPEGDFSAAETTAVLEAGFQAVSFGSITLRVETAVIYGLSVLSYEFG
jgi:16S rRNA (uracil1498-N3)-methyltransferase